MDPNIHSQSELQNYRFFKQPAIAPENDDTLNGAFEGFSHPHFFFLKILRLLSIPKNFPVTHVQIWHY